MSMITMNKTGCKAFARSEKKASLMEKFQNYIVENNDIIVSGLMLISGNANAYGIYKMLNR